MEVVWTKRVGTCRLGEAAATHEIPSRRVHGGEGKPEPHLEPFLSVEADEGTR